MKSKYKIKYHIQMYFNGLQVFKIKSLNYIKCLFLRVWIVNDFYRDELRGKEVTIQINIVS